jgi:hypothetical protein
LITKQALFFMELLGLEELKDYKKLNYFKSCLFFIIKRYKF